MEAAARDASEARDRGTPRLATETRSVLPRAMTNDQYLLGHSPVEQERLRRQVRELEPEARWLLR